MSDYAWFALKGIGYLLLIGAACWLIESAWPLLALLCAPRFTSNDCDCGQRQSELNRLRRVEGAALRVASSRREGIVTDQGALDRLDEVLEAK